MSWPAEQETQEQLRQTLIGTTLELPSSTPELMDALRHDRQALVRDAILWQRWVRYLGFLALVILAISLGAFSLEQMLQPIAVTALVYVVCVAATAEKVRRSES